jgi:hypothetical protein
MSLMLVRCAIGASVLAACGTPAMPALAPKYLFEFEHTATGEALQVTGETQRYVATEDQVVGGKTCFNSYGRAYTCAEDYRTVEVERSRRIVKVFQGRTQIDPFSALRIANDPAFQEAYAARVAEVERERASMPQLYREGMSGTQTRKALGIGLIVASSGVSLVGLALASNEKYRVVMSGTLLASSAMLLGGLYLWRGAHTKQAETLAAAQVRARAAVSKSSFSKYTSEDKLREAAERYNRTLPGAPAAPTAPERAPTETVQARTAWSIAPLALVDARGTTILELDRQGYVIKEGRRAWQFVGDRYGARYRVASIANGLVVYDGNSKLMAIDANGTLTSLQGFTLKVLPSGVVELREHGRVLRSQARFRGVTDGNRQVAAFLASLSMMRLALR